MTRITIIGVGLIGGSMAKDLKSQLNVHVTGVDASASNVQRALELGLVHEMKEIDQALGHADIVILAIPVNEVEKVLSELLDKISSNTIVIDVGSTKESICAAVRTHKRRGRFVAAHPLAGTEFSGPNAALNGLFIGKKNIICDRELSDSDAVEVALKLFNSLGMDSYFLSAEEHDKHLAYVSHLSHLSSFTLSLTVLDIEQDESQIFNLASTGFGSTARLAKSNPDTWTPIFEKNSAHLIQAIEKYSSYLTQFKKALQEKDTSRLYRLMTTANDIKSVLKNNEL